MFSSLPALRRNEHGFSSLLWLLVFFVPVVMIYTVPMTMELTQRYNASVRFQNCVTMAATGVRSWVSSNYTREQWAAVPPSALLSKAQEMYAKTLCARNIGASGLANWSIVSVTSPNAGVYTVKANQTYNSPRGVLWFGTATWTLSETSYWYQRTA